ncbi:MAG: bifunctional phosphoribosyl-AMP cyclohydrolase/phosphoribosyl-ATP diphosphatase HisIE [Clostridiales bacterium]|jgi:phosphoribosyl-ATP pyrophosphohydrolase/phosphoribosyl-AMP cyclohydrolase|nr:bifunctional phosphoribosyl-AMP cyclohydrolase/phosphoribosyl-ATP diphosphatase HisIE [Clostridiales bacterium]
MLNLKFDEKGLLPVVVQDYRSNTVLMQAYMNEESLKLTRETGKATYYSRSREKLWVKGEESGHFQFVKEILADCDGDCLLLKVEQVEAACHTNHFSCFYRDVDGGEVNETPPNPAILYEVYDVICDRLLHPKEGSYTNYLFDKGIDKMCKKVGEEAAEVIIGAKNRAKEEVRYEAADLIFHLWVVLKEIGVTPDDVFAELQKRR